MANSRVNFTLSTFTRVVNFSLVVVRILQSSHLRVTLIKINLWLEEIHFTVTNEAEINLK